MIFLIFYQLLVLYEIVVCLNDFTYFAQGDYWNTQKPSIHCEIIQIIYVWWNELSRPFTINYSYKNVTFYLLNLYSLQHEKREKRTSIFKFFRKMFGKMKKINKIHSVWNSYTILQRTKGPLIICPTVILYEIRVGKKEKTKNSRSCGINKFK